LKLEVGIVVIMALIFGFAVGAIAYLELSERVDSCCGRPAVKMNGR